MNRMATFRRVSPCHDDAPRNLDRIILYAPLSINPSLRLIRPPILLASCASSNMISIYLLSLSYTSPPQSTSAPDSSLVSPSLSNTFTSLVTNTSAPALDIRVGYMGFCMPDSTGDWICSRHADSLARNINSTHQLPGSGDPLNLIYIAKNFQSQIVFDGLMYVPSLTLPANNGGES
jgi:Ca2+ regulator and membrane fusion protein Fig1